MKQASIGAAAQPAEAAAREGARPAGGSVGGQGQHEVEGGEHLVRVRVRVGIGFGFGFGFGFGLGLGSGFGWG